MYIHVIFYFAFPFTDCSLYYTQRLLHWLFCCWDQPGSAGVRIVCPSYFLLQWLCLLWQVSVMWYSPWCIKSIAMGLAATCTSSLVFLWWIWSTYFLPLLYVSSIFSVFKVSVLYLTVTSVLLFCLFTPFSVSSLLKNQNTNLLLE